MSQLSLYRNKLVIMPKYVHVLCHAPCSMICWSLSFCRTNTYNSYQSAGFSYTSFQLHEKHINLKIDLRHLLWPYDVFFHFGVTPKRKNPYMCHTNVFVQKWLHVSSNWFCASVNTNRLNTRCIFFHFGVTPKQKKSCFL